MVSEQELKLREIEFNRLNAVKLVEIVCLLLRNSEIAASVIAFSVLFIGLNRRTLGVCRG